MNDDVIISPLNHILPNRAKGEKQTCFDQGLLIGCESGPRKQTLDIRQWEASCLSLCTLTISHIFKELEDIYFSLQYFAVLVATEQRSLRHCQTLASDQLTIPCLHLIPERLGNTKLPRSSRAARSNSNGGATWGWQRDPVGWAAMGIILR